MTWKEVEIIFNRALSLTFSRKKLCFTAAILVLCGMLIVLCRAIAAKANEYITLSLTFFPIFCCTAVLLLLGILLIRIYHHEIKKLPVSYARTLVSSKGLLIEVAYLCIPLVLAYFVLWAFLGMFYLLKCIPLFGNAFGVIFSFGPFLLLLSFFAICIASVLLLFFMTPCIALQSKVDVELLVQRFKSNPFSNILLLLLGLIPLFFLTGLMIGAAVMTGKSYFEAEKAVEVGFQWFFIMLPFCILLAPTIIFFFNFSAECHALMVKKMRGENSLP
ncbi:MAG TPA: hypothetical protein VGJ00_02990 [Rhabdochlamydiaceae bacterium]|jgi:hypothetical protein